MSRQNTPADAAIASKLPPAEAKEAIRALHEGEADALVVRTPRGEDVYTLESVNRPYRLFVEQMQEGALSIDSDGNILYCNPRFADMVGGTTETIIGRPLEEFIAENRLDTYQKLRQRCDQGTVRGECRIMAADGSSLAVQLTFSPLRPRRIGHCCVIVTDHTDAQRQREMYAAMEAAEAANLAKDQFLAVLSHELRTPLSAVLGWTQMLRKGTMSENETVQGLEAIERNTRSQMQLIMDLLDVSRIAAGKLRLDIALIRPADIVVNAVEAVAFAAQQKGVRYTYAIEDREATVRGDGDRLQQAVANLLNNAVKFTPAGGSVHLELKRCSDYIEIVVTDTGQGINPEELPRLFQSFQQASRPGQHNSGLGLGLYIAKQLVEMQGGRISATSPGPGKGATFTIRLPIVAAELAEENEPNNDAPALEDDWDTVTLEGVHILVVDDSPDSLSMMEVALRDAGAQVSAVSSAGEAFLMLQKNPPDIIISDLSMPGEDGFEFIRRVRRFGFTGRDLPAIALTAMARTEDRRRALLAGFQLHVSKPVDHDELIAAVAGVSTLAGKPA